MSPRARETSRDEPDKFYFLDRRKGINNFEEEGFGKRVQLVVLLLSERRRHVGLPRSETMTFQQVVLLGDRDEGSTEAES